MFFANVDKFVDQLYGDVLRPSDVKQSLSVCLVVSDYRQEFDDDSGKLTGPDNVEMNALHSPNTTAGFECTACRDLPAINGAHEPTDRNDNTQDVDVIQRQNFEITSSRSSSIRIIVLDCCKVTFVDSMAAAAMKKISAAYRNVGVQLVLSGCDAKMTAVMTAAGLLDADAERIEIYPTVHDAVLAVA